MLISPIIIGLSFMYGQTTVHRTASQIVESALRSTTSYIEAELESDLYPFYQDVLKPVHTYLFLPVYTYIFLPVYTHVLKPTFDFVYQAVVFCLHIIYQVPVYILTNLYIYILSPVYNLTSRILQTFFFFFCWIYVLLGATLLRSIYEHGSIIFNYWCVLNIISCFYYL